MSEFRISGTEVVRREVKPIGGGAMVYLPKSWVGRTVAIIADVK